MQFYIFLFKDDYLLHLDPHLSQDFVDVSQEDFCCDSYHAKAPKKLHINKMDSSCCLGFLIESEHHFEAWCTLASELARPLQGGPSECPLFSILEGPSFRPAAEEMVKSEILNQIQQLDSIDEAGIDANSMIPDDSEDFVFI